MENESGHPTRYKSVMDDLRVVRDQNKKLKVQLMEQERVNKLNHVQMLKLEDTIRDLKVAQ